MDFHLQKFTLAEWISAGRVDVFASLPVVDKALAMMRLSLPEREKWCWTSGMLSSTSDAENTRGEDQRALNIFFIYSGDLNQTTLIIIFVYLTLKKNRI